MKAFIDTSSLFKKYIEEMGSKEFDELLNKILEIIVSPVTLLEMNSVIERRVRDKSLSKKEALWIRKEINIDFKFFSKVQYNKNLEQKGLELIQKYQLKTLDSLQLASGYLSKADIFITSDKALFDKASKELKNTHFI